MTQVFFYHNLSDRLAALAALVGKACAQRKELTIYAPDPRLAESIDRLLWTQSPTGFVPHVRHDSPLAAETPVLIAADLESPAQHERLFNLSDEVPPGFSRFSSVIEVVGTDEDERRAGRERVKFYKDRGYEVRFFDWSEKS